MEEVLPNMAEDDGNANDLTTDDETPTPKQPPQQQFKRRSRQRSPEEEQNPKCRSRIDQLAIPSRRLILALYQDHRHHLEKDKVDKIKVLLQELYAMTPEETEKYFEYLKKQAEERQMKKAIKKMLKKLVNKRKYLKQTKRAYAFIYNLLGRAMEFAINNTIPPLVSVRLRNLSNIILEQICDLRNVNIPSRENPDKVGEFLIRVADWTAVAVEQLYYVVQLKKNKELENIEKEARDKEKAKADAEAAKPKSEPETDDEQLYSEPLTVSDMEEMEHGSFVGRIA